MYPATVPGYSPHTITAVAGYQSTRVPWVPARGDRRDPLEVTTSLTLDQRSESAFEIKIVGELHFGFSEEHKIVDGLMSFNGGL